jgi:predicted nucleic acid-binding protein
MRYQKKGLRKGAVELINSLDADETVTIVSISDEIYKAAFKLYRSRLDKEWGLTDCISFIVMEQRGITKALTADLHFQQAGFTVLMK